MEMYAGGGADIDLSEVRCTYVFNFPKMPSGE